MGINRHNRISSFCPYKGKHVSSAIYFKKGIEGRTRTTSFHLFIRNNFGCAGNEFHLDNTMYLIICIIARQVFSQICSSTCYVYKKQLLVYYRSQFQYEFQISFDRKDRISGHTEFFWYYLDN